MRLGSFFKKAYRMAKAAPIAFAFLIVALFGSIISFYLARTVIYREGEVRFSLLVSELRSVVANRINHTLDLSVTLAKSVSPTATKGELDSYFSSLNLNSRYPGARQIGIYATSGTNHALTRLYQYSVTTEPIVVSENDLKNAVALQSNTASDEPFFLKLQENASNYIALIPMQKNTYFFMVFDASSVLSRLFAENSLFNFFDFRIFDTVDPGYPLYETTNDVFVKTNHLYVGEEQFKIGLYPWSLQAKGDNRQLIVATARRMPLVTMLAGVTISFLMFGILFALSWSRKNALVLAENITRNLRVSEEKYRSIFESLQDVYYRTDKDGMITTVSPSVQHYVGIAPENLIGKSATAFYKNPKERDGMLQVLARDGIVKDYPITLVGADGKVIYCSLNARLLKEHGATAGVEGLLRDVSERKRSDDSLRERTKELERLNNLMVNRELRMIELKQEIAELRKPALIEKPAHAEKLPRAEKPVKIAKKTKPATEKRAEKKVEKKVAANVDEQSYGKE